MPVYQVHPKKRKTLDIFDRLSLTSILIIINVLVFFVFYLVISIGGFSLEQAYNYVAIKPSNIVEGNYIWTFITSMFMHGGFAHLLFNMITLFFVGGLVEKILGKTRYFWFYMLSGVFASLLFVTLSLFLFPSEFDLFAVGASGALFGIVGLLVIITPNLPVFVMLIPLPIKMKYAGPGFLFVLWLISIAANLPVGNTAHLGGLIAGLGYGFYLKKKFPRKTQQISRMFS